MVECPVGGSVAPAREGKLLGFLGGADADVAQERARPLDEPAQHVETIWKADQRIHPGGDAGDGQCHGPRCQPIVAPGG